jgi:WhiB family redox-sensing transcriptional regulator
MTPNATTEARLARDDGLYRLLTHLAEFGGWPACADPGVDPEWFFPISASDTGRTRPALATCQRCEVHKSCLRHALRTPETSGIWGGTTEEDRAAMRATGRPVDELVERRWPA